MHAIHYLQVQQVQPDFLSQEPFRVAHSASWQLFCCRYSSDSSWSCNEVAMHKRSKQVKGSQHTGSGLLKVGAHAT